MWITKLAIYANEYNKTIKDRTWPEEKMDELVKKFEDADENLSVIDKNAENSFYIVLRTCNMLRVGR